MSEREARHQATRQRVREVLHADPVFAAQARDAMTREQERADLRALAEAVNAKVVKDRGWGCCCPFCLLSAAHHSPACPVHVARRVLADLKCDDAPLP